MLRFLTRWSTILVFTLGGSVMTQAASVRQSTLVMVALPDKHIPTSDEIIAYFKSSWPDDPPLTADGSKDGTLFFRTPDDEIAFVSLMPTRIPAADTEFACRSAYTWDEACNEFEKSNAHAIVSIIPQRADQLETMIRTTKLAAAVSSLGNGLGVYWCEGETVEQPEMFEASAYVINRQFPPIYLWIGMKVNREKDGLVSVVTRGLQQFDLMNVEYSVNS